MPGLRKQPVEIVLSGGVDTKTNPTLVPAGKLAKLENYAHAGGALQRRPGSRAVWSPQQGTADVVPGSDGMLGRLDERLLLRDKYRLFPFNAKTGKLTPNGVLLESGTPVPVPSLYSRTKRVQGAPGPSRLTHANSSSAGGMTAFAWAELGKMYAVVRSEDGSVLSPTVQLGTPTGDGISGMPNSSAWAVSFQDTVAVVYGLSTGLRIRIADPETGKLGEELSLTSGWAQTFDVALNPDNTLSVLSFEGVNVGDKTVTLFKVSRAGVVTLTTAITGAIPYARLQPFPPGIAVAVAQNGDVFCFYRRINTSVTPSQAEIHCLIRSQAHASIVGDTTILTAPTSVVSHFRLGASPSPKTASRVMLAIDWVDSTLDVGFTLFNEVTETPTFQADNHLQGCRLISKPFSVDGQGAYIVTQGGLDWTQDNAGGTLTSLQSTAFIFDENRELVGRLLQGEVAAASNTGTGTSGYARPVNVSRFTNDDGSPGARFTIICAGAESVSNNRGTLREVEVIRDTIKGWRLTPVQYGKSLYFPGAVPRQFDGANLHEVGFNFFPEGFTVELVANATGMDVGLIGVAIVYEWTDAAGELHESAPSVPYQITTDSGNRRALVTIPTLRLTDKLSTPVQIAIYQTQSNGTLYFRVGAVDNDPDANTVTFTLQRSDDYLVSFGLPYLYTTGGVAENIAPPPCHHISKHQERLVLSTEDGVHFSNRRIDGFAPHFHETFRIDMEGVVATGSLDGRLVLFTRDKVLFSAGEGPDELGGSGAFSPPQVISNKTGCIAPQSVIETPFGLMFQGKRGIYLVQRDLSVEYVGADVEKLVGTITSANHISNREEVRFNQASPGKALVWNYGEGGQWSTITPRQIASAVEFGDGLAWVSGSDEDVTSIYQSDFTCVSDGGDAMEALFESAWLRLGNITGYQRVSRIAMRGTYHGQSLVSVYLAYDGNEDEWLEVVRKQTIDLNLEDGDPIELEAHLKYQKCSSIKIRVVDDGGGGAPSRGVDWVALALELGVRPGMFKVSSLQTLGKPEGSAGS